MKKILALLLILFFTTTGDASLRDRLQPIAAGDLNIAVDSFLIGTHDRYIATIVRDFDRRVIHGVSITMADMLDGFEDDELVMIERRIFDRHAKRTTLAERMFALRDAFVPAIATERFGITDLVDIEPGSVEEIMWYGVAGPDGWGARILDELPEPIILSRYKAPVNEERYAAIALREVGGIFLDRKSVKVTEESVTALLIEAFTFDGEVQFGGLIMQYASQPFVDASYAITKVEVSFERQAYRQLRFTVFGLENQIIYAVRIAAPMWETVEENPVVPFALTIIANNLPEEIPDSLTEDVKSFLEFVHERLEEFNRMRQELWEQRENDELLEQHRLRVLLEHYGLFGLGGLKELLNRLELYEHLEFLEQHGLRELLEQHELYDLLRQRALKRPEVFQEPLDPTALRELMDEYGIHGLQELVRQHGLEGIREILEQRRQQEPAPAEDTGQPDDETENTNLK